MHGEVSVFTFVENLFLFQLVSIRLLALFALLLKRAICVLWNRVILIMLERAITSFICHFQRHFLNAEITLVMVAVSENVFFLWSGCLDLSGCFELLVVFQVYFQIAYLDYFGSVECTIVNGLCSFFMIRRFSLSFWVRQCEVLNMVWLNNSGFIFRVRVIRCKSFFEIVNLLVAWSLDIFFIFKFV